MLLKRLPLCLTLLCIASCNNDQFDLMQNMDHLMPSEGENQAQELHILNHQDALQRKIQDDQISLVDYENNYKSVLEFLDDLDALENDLESLNRNIQIYQKKPNAITTLDKDHILKKTKDSIDAANDKQQEAKVYKDNTQLEGIRNEQVQNNRAISRDALRKFIGNALARKLGMKLGKNRVSLPWKTMTIKDFKNWPIAEFKRLDNLKMDDLRIVERKVFDVEFSDEFLDRMTKYRRYPSRGKSGRFIGNKLL